MQLNERQLRFIQHYLHDTAGNAAAAARLAGYTHPSASGYRLRKSLAKHIETERNKLEHVDIADAKECLKIFTEVARDTTHKDRIKATEHLARIHGLLSDKLNIALDRKALTDALNASLDALTTAYKRKKLIDRKRIKVIETTAKQLTSNSD